MKPNNQIVEDKVIKVNECKFTKSPLTLKLNNSPKPPDTPPNTPTEEPPYNPPYEPPYEERIPKTGDVDYSWMIAVGLIISTLGFVGAKKFKQTA